jgi:hypothetical protein
MLRQVFVQKQKVIQKKKSLLPLWDLKIYCHVLKSSSQDLFLCRFINLTFQGEAE